MTTDKFWQKTLIPLTVFFVFYVFARVSSHVDDLTPEEPVDADSARALHKAWERGRAGIPLTFDEFEMLRRHDLLP